MHSKWDNVLTATLVTCALITTGLVVHRELSAPTPRPDSSLRRKPTFIENWKAQLDRGVRLGPPEAAVQVIEFGDFECPFCAAYHVDLKALREKYPEQVALSYIHFPLPMHQFALPAARAAECAGEQGRFEPMHDRLFEQQREFGRKTWGEFAIEAGVPDPPAFESCIQSTADVPRIINGTRLGRKLDVPGTPTVVVNGWMLPSPPSAEELERMVQAILAGREPVSE